MSELRRFIFNERPASHQEMVNFAKDDYDSVREYIFDYPELNKIKKDIQWGVFWEIVDGMARKSGIDPSKINRVNPNTILGINGYEEDEKEKRGGGNGRCFFARFKHYCY